MEIIKEELLLKDEEFIDKRVDELNLKLAKNGKNDDAKIELFHFEKF